MSTEKRGNLRVFDPARKKSEPKERRELTIEEKKERLKTGLQKLRTEYFLPVLAVVPNLEQLNYQLREVEEQRIFERRWSLYRRTLPEDLKLLDPDEVTTLKRYEDYLNMFEMWVRKLVEINGTARILFGELKEYAQDLEGETEMKADLEKYAKFLDLPGLDYLALSASEHPRDRSLIMDNLWPYAMRVRQAGFIIE